MKVALINSEGGGISSVTMGLGRSLAKKKVDTTIFTYSYSRSSQVTRLSDYLTMYGLPTPDIPPRHYWFQALNFKLFLKDLGDYDVIHGVSPNASYFLSLFKETFNRPFVSTLHEDLRTSRNAFVKQPVYSWSFREMGYFFFEFPLFDIPAGRILRSSDYSTFCSYSLLRQIANYRKIDFNKISVIHNGLDFDEIDSIESERTKNANEITIIFAGRLIRVKGVTFLLEAFKALSKDFPNLKLNIFGTGPLASEIKKAAANPDLKNKVNYLGHVPHKTLIAELKKADIAVFPSLNEAQPMIVLEAMACKKPVVAFDLPFSREVITHMSTGLLAKPADITDLSANISLLIKNRHIRSQLGQAAYRYVKENHNWEIQAGKYLKVYEKAIENRNRGSTQFLRSRNTD